jgi:hypothetical protein
LLNVSETVNGLRQFIRYFSILKKSLSRSLSLKAYRVEAVNGNLSEHLDLNRLRTRLREKPRTKAGQVRQAWPDIRDLLAAGHRLKDIWAWLNELGVDVGYTQLSHCISELRLRDQAALSQTQDLRRQRAPIESDEQTAVPEQPGRDDSASKARLLGNTASDPLRNVREQRARKQGFDYDPFPTKGLTL